MTGWTDTPPAPCAVTGHDEPHAGPYYVEEVLVSRAHMTEEGPRLDRRVRPIVISASHLRTICADGRSPFVLTTREEATRQQLVAAERDELATRVEELEAEVARLREGIGAIDAQAFASTLVPLLRQEFRSKPGRRPQEAA